MDVHEKYTVDIITRRVIKSKRKYNTTNDSMKEVIGSTHLASSLDSSLKVKKRTF